jgi:hypothetical protein
MLTSASTIADCVQDGDAAPYAGTLRVVNTSETHATRRTPHAARRTPHAARRTPHAARTRFCAKWSQCGLQMILSKTIRGAAESFGEEVASASANVT